MDANCEQEPEDGDWKQRRLCTLQGMLLNKVHRGHNFPMRVVVSINNRMIKDMVERLRELDADLAAEDEEDEDDDEEDDVRRASRREERDAVQKALTQKRDGMQLLRIFG